MFVDQIRGTENIYPFYAWRIFHTEPDRRLNKGFLYIHRLDGKVFSPPCDLYDIKERFPSANMYSLQQKINRLASQFHSQEAAGLKESIERTLLKDWKFVRWELIEKEFDPIEYYMSKKTIQQRTLGVFEIGEKNN